MNELLVATRSPGKMREIRRILADVPGLRVLDLDQAGVDPSPVEEGLEPFDTFEENAASKAGYFMERSGLPTVADDSGLEVDALDGAPGVRSKRFAPVDGVVGRALDEANNAHLVALLDGVPLEDRTARYVCVAVLAEPGRDPLVFRGDAPGIVIDELRGEGGFGYDPVMYEPDVDKTFAEMAAAEKDAHSHRGAAFRSLAAYLLRRP
jgi:XTP/dITP diphosphohydrolase